MADKILKSALDIDPRVGLERDLREKEGRADGALPVRSFAAEREKRVAQLSFCSPQLSPVEGMACRHVGC